MKRFLFSLILIVGANVNAQDTSYAKIYEPTIGQLTNDFPVSDAGLVWDDGLITSGVADFGTHPSFLARISPIGELVWQWGFGDGSIPDPAISFDQVIATKDSNFITVGIFRDNLTFESRPFCMKLNAAGDTLWTKSFILSNQSFNAFRETGRVIETKDSMLLVGFDNATFSQSPTEPDHLCLAKLSMNGDVVWSKSYITDSLFALRKIVQAEDSSLYVIGQSGEDADYSILLNFHSDGQLNWGRKYVGVQFEDLELGGSNLFVSWIDNDTEIGVLKLDSAGNHIRRVQYMSASNDFRGISSTRRSNGNIISAPIEYSSYFPVGFHELDDDLNSVNRYESQMFMNEVISIPGKGFYSIGFGPIYGVKAGDVEMGVVRFDSLSNPVNCSYVTGSNVTLLDSVVSTNILFPESDSLVFTSTNLSFFTLDFISEDDCVTFLGSVDEIEGTWNETISPNPSTGKFTIDWNEYREAELVVYNSIGVEIHRSTVSNSFVEVDLHDQKNGLYYYRLTDREGSQSNGKLILME